MKRFFCWQRVNSEASISIQIPVDGFQVVIFDWSTVFPLKMLVCLDEKHERFSWQTLRTLRRVRNPSLAPQEHWYRLYKAGPVLAMVR